MTGQRVGSTENPVNLKEFFEGAEWTKLMRNARDGGATSIFACRILQKTMTLLSKGALEAEMMLQTAQAASGTSVGIGKISEDLKRVSTQTAIVSTSANVEAHRVGAAGESLLTVAKQMEALASDTRELSRSIGPKLSGVNDRLALNLELCSGVQKLFRDMHQELEEFRRHMEAVESSVIAQVDQLEGLEKSMAILARGF